MVFQHLSFLGCFQQHKQNQWIPKTSAPGASLRIIKSWFWTLTQKRRSKWQWANGGPRPENGPDVYRVHIAFWRIWQTRHFLNTWLPELNARALLSKWGKHPFQPGPSKLEGLAMKTNGFPLRFLPSASKSYENRYFSTRFLPGASSSNENQIGGASKSSENQCFLNYYGPQSFKK